MLVGTHRVGGVIWALPAGRFEIGVRWEIRDAPVHATRMIGSESHTLGPNRLSDVVYQITLWSSMNRIPSAGAGSIPKRNSVMVFGDRNNVLCARGFEKLGPAGRVELLSLLGIQNIIAGGTTVNILMVLPGRAALNPNGV